MGTGGISPERSTPALTGRPKSDILEEQSNRGLGMKGRRTTQLGSLLAAAVLALGLAARGYAQMPAWDPGPPSQNSAIGSPTKRDESRMGTHYELCIEQSPAQAGKLSPDSGTHRFSADAVVVLSAEPEPGYQFACWLGDVADPKSQRTTVRVSSSKMVVAVFHPAEADYPKEVLIGGGGGGRSSTVATRIDLSTPGWSIGGGGKVKSEVITVPVPVPEPATILLLGLGAVALRRRLR
jgi:hypothetical protein